MDINMIHLYFGARQTCLEMLKDRSYDVPQHLFCLTEKQFGQSHEKNMSIGGITDQQKNKVFIKMFNGKDKTTLFNEILYLINTELKEKDLPKKTIDKSTDVEAFVNEIKNIRVIIIYDPRVATAGIVKLDETYIGHAFIEAFDVHLMFINPSKHIYQPKWRLMNETEITQMLQRYEAKSAHPSRVLLGSVCIDDPMNRYYGGKPPSKDRKNGDIYEIIRDGVNIFYRKVSSKRMNLKS